MRLNGRCRRFIDPWWLTQFPILKRLLPSVRKRLFWDDTRYRIVSRNGGLFLVNFFNWADRTLLLQGSSERNQIAYLLDQVVHKQCEIFIDVGAHFGTYTIFVALKTACREIFAFEPDLRNYAQLEANLLLNDLVGRVDARPVAISDHVGRVSFLASPAPYNVWSKIVEGTAEETTVPAVRLDEIFDFRHRKLALKIDIEGHELQALDGMKKLLSENECVVQVECFEANFPVFKQAIGDLGYRLIHEIAFDRYFANS